MANIVRDFAIRCDAAGCQEEVEQTIDVQVMHFGSESTRWRVRVCAQHVVGVKAALTRAMAAAVDVVKNGSPV